MKKKKLHIQDLKVKSFVNNLESEEMKQTKGGAQVEHDEGRAIRLNNNNLPWNIRVHAWTISEIRNDGRPYNSIKKEG